jgi:hypothetical protein
MPLIDEWRKRRADRKTTKAAADAQERARIDAARREAARQERIAAARARLAEWQEAENELEAMLNTARNVKNLKLDDTPLALNADETAYLVIRGASLIEPRRLPGHWEGTSQAISFRVPGTKSMRYRIGGNRGTFIQGDEVPQAIDTGTVTVTDQRVVFQGSRQAREWAFKKILGFQHNDEPSWTTISVSNRQKVSGFMYTEQAEESVRFWLTLAIAQFHGRLTEVVTDLEQQIEEHRRVRPALPSS